MLAKRIIPCLDVKSGIVVKGVRFRDHKAVGDILKFAKFYRDAGADELIFYDISASSDLSSVSTKWISKVARCIDIPLCVAGGIRDITTAKAILNSGADKISINSPALENPHLISQLANVFGRQCVVVGVDSLLEEGNYYVYQYTGDEKKMRATKRLTLDWLKEVQDLGAGEVVLNCMNRDGVRQGYDLQQLEKAREILQIPMIASGGAGKKEHFADVFQLTNADGALAASIFHTRQISILDLKKFLHSKNIEVRL